MGIPKVKLVFTIALIVFASRVTAQEDYVDIERKKRLREELPVCPKIFLGPSVGVNNNGGVFANNLEIGVDSHVSLGAGFGIGLWGFKGYIEGKYYFKECYKGWAIGLAVTRAGGLGEFVYQDSSGTFPQTVIMRMLPQTNIALQGYRYFKMGRRHRFHICGGYSFETTTRKFQVIGPNQPSYTLGRTMDLIAPGGFIIGCGFSFGL